MLPKLGRFQSYIIIIRNYHFILINCNFSLFLTDKDPAGHTLLGIIWFPNLGSVFVWKVLKDPHFLLITLSVVIGR